jgi:hypothetical protein
MFVSNTSVPAGAQDFPVPETAVWRFAPLTARSYDVLVIDPPWHFSTWESGWADQQVGIGAVPHHAAHRDHGLAGARVVEA